MEVTYTGIYTVKYLWENHMACLVIGWCSRCAVWLSPSNHCHGQGGWWRISRWLTWYPSGVPSSVYFSSWCWPNHWTWAWREHTCQEWWSCLSSSCCPLGWFGEWGAHTLLINYLNVLSASRYPCAKPWLTLLWKACLTTIRTIDYSWV